MGLSLTSAHAAECASFHQPVRANCRSLLCVDLVVTSTQRMNVDNGTIHGDHVVMNVDDGVIHGDDHNVSHLARSNAAWAGCADRQR
jgi:hypothetical protein